MASSDVITRLVQALESLVTSSACTCEGDKRRLSLQAQDIVVSNGLDATQQEAVREATRTASNPTGWYYESHGIREGIAMLKELMEQAHTAPKPLHGFNIRNLANLVSDGAIFSVEFIKRTDGSLRKMKCRMGVKKHLRGGDRAYQPASKGLLTVFDMEKRGYRSIPVDAIQRLTVNGQLFTFETA